MALLEVPSRPGLEHGFLRVTDQSPSVGQELAVITWQGHERAMAPGECTVTAVDEGTFHYFCDAVNNTSRWATSLLYGAPILTADGQHLLGIHISRDDRGWFASRADVLASSSSTD